MLAEKYGGKVMERGNFTRQAIEAMEYAKEVAISFGMNYIGTEHLLAGISKVSEVWQQIFCITIILFMQI